MADVQSTGALADDPIGGLLTVTDGMMHYLTRCCGASAKGSANGSTGVVCRACYCDIDPEIGNAWMVDDPASWTQYQDRLGAYFGDQAAVVANQLRARALERTYGSSQAV